MVPYDENSLYVGDPEFIDEIFRKLHDAKSHQFNHRIALYGMGRIGKTQTALRYVYEMRDNYRAIFWISGENESTLLNGFGQIREQSDCVPETSDQNKTAKQVIDGWKNNQV